MDARDWCPWILRRMQGVWRIDEERATWVGKGFLEFEGSKGCHWSDYRCSDAKGKGLHGRFRWSVVLPEWAPVRVRVQDRLFRSSCDLRWIDALLPPSEGFSWPVEATDVAFPGCQGRDCRKSNAVSLHPTLDRRLRSERRYRS